MNLNKYTLYGSILKELVVSILTKTFLLKDLSQSDKIRS